MMAPPHVQAQSFARAILTDMIRTLFWRWLLANGVFQIALRHLLHEPTDAKEELNRKDVNYVEWVNRPVWALLNCFRPNGGHSVANSEPNTVHP